MDEIDVCPVCGQHIDCGFGPWDDDDPEGDLADESVPCSICSCLIGDEVAYGDTWDGRWVCAGCAGMEDEDDEDTCDSEDD